MRLRTLVAGPGGDRIVAIKVTEANYEASTLRFLKGSATCASEDRTGLGSASGAGAARWTDMYNAKLGSVAA